MAGRIAFRETRLTVPAFPIANHLNKPVFSGLQSLKPENPTDRSYSRRVTPSRISFLDRWLRQPKLTTLPASAAITLATMLMITLYERTERWGAMVVPSGSL